MFVLNTIAPVFLVIALGAALRKARFLDDQLLGGLNRVAYLVALPALLFHKAATAQALDPGVATAFLIVLAGTLGVLALGLLAALLTRMPSRSAGSFLQAAFRGNIAYVGLAVVLYASNDWSAHTAAAAQAAAVFALAPLVVLYNVTAVVALRASRRRLTAAALLPVARSIITNPLILASLAGAAVALLRWPLPPLLDRTLGVVGQFALPAALLAIGGALIATDVRARLGLSLLAALLKTAVAPTVGLLAAFLLGASPEHRFVALIYLACPTAVVSYVLTDQLGGDTPLAAGAIALSTLLSVASLSVVLYFA